MRHIGEAHYTEADLSVGQRHLGDFFEGILIGVDDIVEKMHGVPHHFTQVRVVDGAVFDHVGEIDGPQVAGFVGQKGLFSARIRTFDLSHVRCRILSVDDIEENQSGFSVPPGRLNDLVEDLAG